MPWIDFGCYGAVALMLSSVGAAQVTELVSVNSAAVPGNYNSVGASISSNGRYVAFFSAADQIVANDFNNTWDIFLRDRLAGSTVRVSVTSAGGEANNGSLFPSVSDDGQYIAFDSYASNLVSADLNGQYDVFLRDESASQTILISRATTGGSGNDDSITASISGDGQTVAFVSWANDLVPNDFNGHPDVFVWARATGQVTRASVDALGGEANSSSDSARISRNGSHVAFGSTASNLILGDGNLAADIFVKVLATGQVERVSLTSLGGESNGNSFVPSISEDGRYVAFESTASNLVSNDGNGVADVFVRDRILGTTRRASTSAAGVGGNAASFAPAISSDGNFVAFMSNASNLVPGDTNGSTDAFVRNVATGGIALVSRSTVGTIGDAESGWPCISRNGNVAVFESIASNLVPGDLNGAWDVFSRVLSQTYYRDADGDLFGDPSQSVVAATPPPGYVLDDGDCDDTRAFVHPGALEQCNGLDDDCDGQIDEGLTFVTYYLDADGDGFGQPGTDLSSCQQPLGYVTDATDCDDTRAFVHPGAPELCNGIDDNCDGVIDEGFLAVYCTAGTTVHGCVPSIAGLGAPSTTAPSGFEIVVSNVPGDQMGTIFYGFYPTAHPWSPASPSYRCVSVPFQRTGNLYTGGTVSACDGDLHLDFNAYITTHPGAMGLPPSVGQVFYAQGWFRDPGAPKQTNLSDALRFVLCN